MTVLTVNAGSSSVRLAAFVLEGGALRACGAQRHDAGVGTPVELLTAFVEQYRNPLFRLPMTFIEIFPVGVIVSLATAALLRNSRFLPARKLPAA